jgi:hypothetical protein
MAENEDAFVVEAQDHAILIRSASPWTGRRRSGGDTISHGDEETPLLPQKSPILEATDGTSATAAPPSGESLVTKPWLGYEGLPFFKRPSVR